MSLGLFNKVAAAFIAVGTAVWGWDQIAPRASVVHIDLAKASPQTRKSPEPAPAPRAKPETPAPVPVPRVVNALSARLTGDHARDSLAGIVDWTALNAFYAGRHYAPAWTGGEPGQANAQVALDVLNGAEGQGLNSVDYYFSSAATLTQNPPPPAIAADFELLLSDALLRYARDVRIGRVRTDPADPDKAFVPQSFDAARAVLGALRDNRLGAFLADLPPRYPQYRALVTALAAYRAKTSDNLPPRIPAGAPIDLMSDDPRLTLLRQRLVPEDGNLSPVAPAYGGSDGLRGAVMRFQARNGLPADGFVGPETLEMLNARPADRIVQIIANMERWRWLPHAPDARAIFVQLPEAVIRYVEDGRVVLESRAIFGRPTNPSPAMGVKVTGITINPPWHAPESITVNEFLPALRNDPNFLRDQNMVLVGGPPGDPYGTSINWNAVSAQGFPYAIHQRAGAASALGRIKFEMPNNYIVYLHDTPDHYFFGLPNQALSHGCIRVDKPFDLAAHVIGGDPAKARAKIDALVAAKATTRIDLAEPVPVYILYLTAIARDDGTVQFYPDLYGRDPALKAALQSATSALGAGL